MKKKTALWILLDLVFLIVFNVVFFVATGTKHPASVWIAYVFIHFAYLMVLATPYLIRKSSSAAVFGFSLYSISSVYFLVQLVVGIVFICLKQESIKVSLITQIIIAGIYAIILISNLIANESTADSLEKHEAEVAYIKESSSRVRSLMDKLDDKRANKAIEKTYDLLHASPAKSSLTVQSLEREILSLTRELETAVFEKDVDSVMSVTEAILSKAEERNRRLKMSH